MHLHHINYISINNIIKVDEISTKRKYEVNKITSKYMSSNMCLRRKWLGKSRAKDERGRRRERAADFSVTLQTVQFTKAGFPGEKNNLRASDWVCTKLVEFGVPGSARKCWIAIEHISHEPWRAAWAQKQCSELPLGIRKAWAAMFNCEDLDVCLPFFTH